MLHDRWRGRSGGAAQCRPGAPPHPHTRHGNAARPGSTVKSIDPSSEVAAEEDVKSTHKLGPKPQVAISVFLGPIEIAPSPDETVRVTITKKAGGKTKEEAEKALAELTVTTEATND